MCVLLIFVEACKLLIFVCGGRKTFEYFLCFKSEVQFQVDLSIKKIDLLICVGQSRHGERH